MRIVYLLDEFMPFSKRGAARIVFDLSKFLSGLGHEVVVLTTVQDKKWIREEKTEGVTIRRIYANYPVYFRNYLGVYNPFIKKSLIKILTEYKPDIIHAHSISRYFSWASLKWAKSYVPKVFITVHDVRPVYNGKLFKRSGKISWLDRIEKDGLVYNPFQFYFIKKYLKISDKIFVVSRALKEILSINGIGAAEILYNGIVVSEWKCETAPEKLILFAGQADDAKGTTKILESFKIVSGQNPDVKLCIVGAGPTEMRRLTGIRKKLNIASEKVQLLEWVDRIQLKKLLCLSYLVVTPSVCFDSFPTINLEAMAAAKPVMGNDFGGAKEQIVDGETGYIVNPFNMEEMAGKIIYLLKNPEIAKKFGEAGRKRVEEEFNLDEMAKRHLKYYEK